MFGQRFCDDLKKLNLSLVRTRLYEIPVNTYTFRRPSKPFNT